MSWVIRMADKHLPARTALGQASEAVTAALRTERLIRERDETIACLQQQVRDLQQALASANLCIGRRGSIGQEGE